MTEETKSYDSISEIRQRKLKIKGALSANEKSIGRLWNNLFHTGNAKSVPTPSRKLSSMLTTGAGIADGAILGWKLYRRFKKK